MTAHRNHGDRSPLPAQRKADGLLSVAEAADRLGTPVRFVRRLITERRIRFYKVGRYVRFDANDLDAFVDAGRVEPRTDGRR